MKKIILFLIVGILVVYGVIALLSTNLFGGSSKAKADDWMIVQYYLVDSGGNLVTDNNGNQIMETDKVPLYYNAKTGLNETKKNKSKFKSAKAFNYSGYDFEGWYLNGVKYKPGQYLPAGLTGAYLDVTSNWTAKLYQVSFDAQGATNPSSMWVRYDDQYGHVIATNSYITKVNNTFAGWWTSPTGGKQILPGDYVKITSNTTLYAHWTRDSATGVANPYTINFNGNGSTGGSMNPQTATAGSNVWLNSNQFYKDNHRFDGWSTYQGGGVVYANGGAIYNISQHYNLWAVWSPLAVDNNTYCTVAYDANGGSVAGPDSDTVVYGNQINLKNYSENGKKPGYTFGGWCKDPNGTGTIYPVGAVYTVTASVTFYVKWNPVTTSTTYYTVSFSTNGGSSYVESIQVASGGQVTLPYYSGTRTGYDQLSGWNILGATYSAGQTIYVTADMKFYARWMAKNYTVYYYSNGSNIDSKTVTYDSTYGTLLIPTARTGYAFAGWFINSSFSGTALTASTFVTNASNHNVYAKWVVNTFTLSFYSNGSLVDTKTATYGSAYGTLPTPPARTGYIFAGWFTNFSYTGTALTASTICTLTSAQNIYAKWVS